MLTPQPINDIDLFCGYCYKVLASVRTQVSYASIHDTCVYCGKRLFFVFSVPKDECP